MLSVAPTRPAGAKYCQKGLYMVHGKIYQAKNITDDVQIVHDHETLYEQEGTCAAGEHGKLSPSTNSYRK